MRESHAAVDVGPDALDPLADALREQGRCQRGAAPAGLDDRIVSAWKTDQRESSASQIGRPAAAGAGRALAAAACVLLVGSAAMLARRNPPEPVQTPAASMALSSGLRALPGPAESMAESMARMASMPLRREAALLSAETRRVLVGLDVFPRPRVGRPEASPGPESGGGT